MGIFPRLEVGGGGEVECDSEQGFELRTGSVAEAAREAVARDVHLSGKNDVDAVEEGLAGALSSALGHSCFPRITHLFCLCALGNDSVHFILLNQFDVTFFRRHKF